MKDKIKIGNAAGFWRDDLEALKRQITCGELDYITIDYLAEITMSILKKQQLKNKELGYVTDFVHQIVEVAPLLKAKKIKVISNAGGINPVGCAREILRQLKNTPNSLKIAIVEGDNIIDELSEIYPKYANFKNMEDGRDFAEVSDKIQSANVYLGVVPIVEALKSGADIIIAGRVTDTSITMAPMVYEFGWQLNDWNKLASGLVASHIIECGAQASGGNFTDWEKVDDWENFGYPITEVYPDGHFYITKHPDTGGLITLNSVKEQLLYEMGNPASYISPDVVVDFRSITVEETETNRVKVSNVTGYSSTTSYKVSMAYADKYKASGSIIISGNNALQKAEKFANIFWKRLNCKFLKDNTEYIGYNSCHQNMASKTEPDEILLRFSVYDDDKSKINKFSQSIAPLILSGPPGVAVTGGRPKIQNVMTYWPALIPKSLITSTVSILDNEGKITKSIKIPQLTGFDQDIVYDQAAFQTSDDNIEANKDNLYADDKKVKVKFAEICLARSGDKGDTANIGVIARSKDIYDYLKTELTAKYLKKLFSVHCKGKIIRYELDNLQSFNFLLEESLDGGGTKSLMIDAQGKTFASALLNQVIEIPSKLLHTIN